MFRSRSFHLTLALLLLAVVAMPALAEAQYTARDHDGGMLIRLSLGFGGSTMETTLNTGEKIEMKDYGGNYNLAIGGVVGGNTAIHATLAGWGVSDPEIDVDGVTQQAFQGSSTMSMLGAGATWYWMPRNIYVSGSLGFGWLSASDHNKKLDTGTGGAFDLTLGKEWWLSERWGLGVALALQGYSVPSSRSDDITGGAIGVRVSATFN